MRILVLDPPARAAGRARLDAEIDGRRRRRPRRGGRAAAARRPLAEHAGSVVHPAAAAGHPRGGLVAGQPARRARPTTRSARTRSAASPTPPPGPGRWRPWRPARAGYRPGDTDLAWTRLTPWRTMLAAALDQPYDPITAGRGRGAARQPAAARCSPSWLRTRLGVPVAVKAARGPGDHRGAAGAPTEGDMALTRPDGRVAQLTRPGLPRSPRSPCPGVGRGAARRGAAPAGPRRHLRARRWPRSTSPAATARRAAIAPAGAAPPTGSRRPAPGEATP